MDLKINPLSKNTLAAEGNGKVSFSGYWGNNQGLDSDQSDNDEEVNDAVMIVFSIRWQWHNYYKERINNMMIK